jgi:protocatechuate 3,4-dioxygenase beta subunit
LTKKGDSAQAGEIAPERWSRAMAESKPNSNFLTGYLRPPADVDPMLMHPAYESTRKRAPLKAPIIVEHTVSEITGPRLAPETINSADADLSRFNGGSALGERIIVSGRVLDENGRAVPHSVIEIWQANAAGRYAHDVDQHDAPLDPHFSGIGRAVTNESGEYRFLTIKPGAYPWRNHFNAWRPAHIHYSLMGPAFVTRLITQMYFEGDPLLALDPIFNSIPNAEARQRLIARFDIANTEPERAIGYHFDFVLRGRQSTSFGE